MRKVNTYKCPICGRPYKTLSGWGNHLDLEHPGTIPEGYSYARYFYFIQTGKTSGKCIVCGKPTEWNEELGKYDRFCKDPKCKEEYREIFKNRMINKYGKVHLLDDPDKQREMLKNRSISGEYKFHDGTKIPYVGSYEEDFLKMMDEFFQFKGTDIMGPSPHTYYYEYEGERKFYIPDFYIPTLNLEIEIKDDTTTHPKIRAVDKVKEEAKDKVMFANESVYYLKLVNKDYKPLFGWLVNMKENAAFPDNKVPMQMVLNRKAPANESVVTIESAINLDEIITPVEDVVFDDTDISMEADTSSIKKMYPIYVILMHTGAPMSKAIRKVINSTFTHSSIALDPSFKTMYTFAITPCNKINENEFKASNGFVVEDKDSPFFKDRLTPYAVYMVKVNGNQLSKIKKRLKYFIDNNTRFKYNFAGLIKNLLNIPESDTNKYFCSQFVSNILRTGNSSLTVKDNDALVTPDDLASIKNSVLIETGQRLCDHDGKKLEEKSNKLIQANESVTDVSASSYCPNPDDVTDEDKCDHNNVSAVIINDDHEILLIDHIKLNAWSIPVGKAYPGETLEKALVREMNEELGIIPIDFKEITSKEIQYRIDDITYTTVNHHIFFINEFKGVIKNMEPNKSRSLVWQHIGELDKLTSITNSLKIVIDNRDAFRYEVTRSLVGKITNIYNGPLMESVVSKLDPDFTPGETLNLNKFNSLLITPASVKKYKDDCKSLSHLRTSNEYKGYLFVDGEKTVAFVNVNVSLHTIQALEVTGEYKGHGLSKQLLDFAVRKLQADNLTVNKNNKIAIRLYEKYGFKMYKSNNNIIYYKLPNSKIENRFAVESFDNPTADLVRSILDSKSFDRIWLSSDWHLYSPDKETVVPEDQIIKYQNEKVGDFDAFIFLGDLCHKDCVDMELLYKTLRNLNGYKVLIKGNHDVQSNAFYEKCGFALVTDMFQWRNYLFTHIPMDLSSYDTDVINIHGHLHGEAEYWDMDPQRHVDVHAASDPGFCATLKDVLEFYDSKYKFMVHDIPTPRADESFMDSILSGDYDSNISKIGELLIDFK